MVVLTTILYVYLILGVIYALYILFFGVGKLIDFPINALLGPFFVIYILYKTIKKEKIRY